MVDQTPVTFDGANSLMFNSKIKSKFDLNELGVSFNPSEVAHVVPVKIKSVVSIPTEKTTKGFVELHFGKS